VKSWNKFLMQVCLILRYSIFTVSLCDGLPGIVGRLKSSTVY
jgi:hypothetical protein